MEFNLTLVPCVSFDRLIKFKLDISKKKNTWMNGIQIKLNFTRKIGNTRALCRIFCRRKNLKPFQDEFRIQRNISNVNESPL